MTTIVGNWMGPSRGAPAEAATTRSAPAFIGVHRCVVVDNPAAIESPMAPVPVTAHAMRAVTGGGMSLARAGTAPQPGFVPDAVDRPSRMLVAIATPPRLRAVEQVNAEAAPAPRASVVVSVVPLAATPAGAAAPRAAERAPSSPADPSSSVAGSDPATPPPAPKRELFRREALDAQHGLVREESRLPRPTASAWSILAVIASLTFVAFGGAAIAKVEVTVKAPGALRAPDGLRPVESTLPGSVTSVSVRAGDEVAQGQVIARLAVAQLEASLALREKELEVLQRDSARAERADQAYAKRIELALRQRRSVLQRRTSINQAQRGQRQDLLARMQQSVREGVASVNDELTSREGLQTTLDAEQVLRAGIADIDVQLAEMSNRLEDRALTRQTDLGRAAAAVAESRSLIERAEIRSPSAGRVESLLVRAGAVIESGQLLAQIVPNVAPRSIVAFLPSRETAFVSVGTSARVEVESLPIGEFGMARAMVTRISADIAKPEELAAAFGETTAGSFVRVELELQEETPEMAPHLRSGERVTVRLHRRERRILSVMFEFARTWLGQ